MQSIILKTATYHQELSHITCLLYAKQFLDTVLFNGHDNPMIYEFLCPYEHDF